MPKIVDHDQRRSELIGAALRLISRSGVGGVTTRAVSEEAGWSTGVLAHYFHSREELLAGALKSAADEQGEVYNGILTSLAGQPLDALVAITDSVLPLDERRITMTRIFLFFYAEAATDNKARAVIDGYLHRWKTVVAELITDAQMVGLISTSLDPATEASHLVSATDGIAMHMLLAGRDIDVDAAVIVQRWLDAARQSL